MGGVLTGLVLLLLALSTARAQTVENIAWQGEDLHLRFSDSAAYAVDVDESDTARAVVRLWGVRYPRLRRQLQRLEGPEGRVATIERNPPNEILVTLTGSARFGCVTLWQPYSRTLVVHTFRWEGLTRATESYYRALLAFEQNNPDLGVSLLRNAHTGGESRARSALGAWYARRGDTALARRYLDSGTTTEELAAIESIQSAAGDSAGAAASRERRVGLERAQAQPGASTDGSTTSSGTMFDRWFTRENLPTLLITIGGALLLIVLIVVMVRRARRSRRQRGTASSQPSSTPGVRVVPTVPEPTVVVPESVDGENLRAMQDERETAVVMTEEIDSARPLTESLLAVETDASPVEGVPEDHRASETAAKEREAPDSTNSHDQAAVDAAPVEKADHEVEPAAEEIIAEGRVESPEMPPAETEVDAAPPHDTAPAFNEIEADEKAKTSAPVEQTAEIKSTSTSPRTRSQQADELRQRLEAARSSPPVPASAPDPHDTRIDEARRGDLSRDAVELRRRLSGGDRPGAGKGS